ncbi:MAG: hypothetical protein CMO80_01890 [Verrucomicrobiales bacterium]|nr:hypothetical protein [Verrucomicrobiales bacterium]
MNRLVPSLILVAALPLCAQTVKDREGAVRGDREKMSGNSRWIYNDVEAGFAEARRTGKPLMVVLRCVPCMACMGIDEEVLTENRELKSLMDQFVRLRIINANSLDLSRFQFDYDLSFSTLFFNGDGTVYGRYGSWEHQHDSQNRATETFRRALEGALGLHRRFPSNRDSLRGKQGGPFPYKRPVEMPILSGKYDLHLNWKGNVVKSCVHCHQIGDSIRLDHRNRKEAIPSKWIYPYPALEVLGVETDSKDFLKVSGITPGTPASRSDLKPGDRIESLDSQPLISTADIAWALHEAAERGRLAVTWTRGTQSLSGNISLKAGWLSATDISDRVGTWPMRAMALYVKHLGRYGKHGAAMRAGFLKHDVLIGLDGKSDRTTESRLIGEVLLHHQGGRRITAIVLRGKRRLDLELPIQ